MPKKRFGLMVSPVFMLFSLVILFCSVGAAADTLIGRHSLLLGVGIATRVLMVKLSIVVGLIARRKPLPTLGGIAVCYGGLESLRGFLGGVINVLLGHPTTLSFLVITLALYFFGMYAAGELLYSKRKAKLAIVRTPGPTVVD